MSKWEYWLRRMFRLECPLFGTDEPWEVGKQVVTSDGYTFRITRNRWQYGVLLVYGVPQ